MSVDLSRVAYQVRKASESTPHPLKHGHAQQLVAAALGYGSLAAYQAAISAGEESADLVDAAHVVLQLDVLEERASTLVPQADLSLIANAIRQAFSVCLPSAAVHGSENEWFDALVDLVEQKTLNHDRTSSEMAVTNSDGVAEVYMPFDVSLDDLPALGDVHEERIVGHVAMEPDLERPYSGHKIDVFASLFLERLGRSVLADARFELSNARLDYNWSGDDDDTPDPASSSGDPVAARQEVAAILTLEITKIVPGFYQANHLHGGVEVTPSKTYARIDEAIRAEAQEIPQGFAHFIEVRYAGFSSGTLTLEAAAHDAENIASRLVDLVAQEHLIEGR